MQRAKATQQTAALIADCGQSNMSAVSSQPLTRFAAGAVLPAKASVSLPRLPLFLFGVFAFSLLFLLLPEMAHAAGAGSGGTLPWENWLGQLRSSVTGPVAYALSVIGLVVAGGTLIFGGELNAFFRTLIFLVLVMALIITANNLMSGWFGSSGAEIGEFEPTTQALLKSADALLAATLGAVFILLLVRFGPRRSKPAQQEDCPNNAQVACDGAAFVAKDA